MTATGWRRSGPFEYLSTAHGQYVRPARSQPFLANPPCATESYYLNDWSMTANVWLAGGGPGLPRRFATSRPVAGQPGILAVPATADQAAGTRRRVGHDWLEITGGSGPAQQLQPMNRITVSPKIRCG